MASGDGIAAATIRPRLRKGLSVLAGVCFALLGLVTAPVAALVSRMCWRPGAITVPYGLVLSVAASLAVVVLARAVSRPHAFAAAAGWLVGLAYVLKGTSGGGFVVSSDALGWAFLVLGTVAVLGPVLRGGASS